MTADEDGWNASQGVGETALAVAWARAEHSASPNPLFRDPYAQRFIDAAVADGWRSPSGPMAERIRSIGDYMASRTKWFDDFVRAAGDRGITQLVILAAGLDARGWRVPLPDATVVYEIDQPGVLAFKAGVLRDDPPVARNVPVPVDLRLDWPTTLQAKGFDPSRPTAWTAEGLLPYLPAAAQDLLFERVGGLSAPGSWIAVESFGAGFFDPEQLATRRDQLRRLREASGEDDSEVRDLEDLWHVEQRSDLAEWLAARGWSVTSVGAEELMRRYGRRPVEEAANPRTVFIEGNQAK